MEVMEEGNLMDRIPILLQRDMEYYEVSKERHIITNDFSQTTTLSRSKIRSCCRRPSARELSAGAWIFRATHHLRQ
jgi:hypothetical protein